MLAPASVEVAAVESPAGETRTSAAKDAEKRHLIFSDLFRKVSPDGGIEDIFESPTLFNKKPPALLSRSYGALDNRAWNWYFFDIFASTFLVQFLAVTVSG